jgi:ABC-2 type transport system ATP-binding protein
MADTQKAISITNLSKTYQDGTKALQDVSLDIQKGDFFGLLGANGAGKTTMIGCLTSLVQKTEGKIHIQGVDIDQDFSLAKKHIGIVPQEFNFNIFEKVIDVVCYQAGFYGMTRAEAEESAKPILERLQLWEKKDNQARTLSGGMKRRLMIARALIHNPKILILDEPTAGVDVELRVDMWDYLRKLNQEGLTILLTTHYLEEAEQLTNKIAIIQKGKIIKNDDTKKLLTTLDEETYVINFSKKPTEKLIEELKLTQTEDSLTYEVTLNRKETITSFFTSIPTNETEVLDIRPKGNRLEQLYLQLTSKK